MSGILPLNVEGAVTRRRGKVLVGPVDLRLGKNGTTIVMVTHSPAYAEYGSRLVHLFDGQVVTENFMEKFYV